MGKCAGAGAPVNASISAVICTARHACVIGRVIFHVIVRERALVSARLSALLSAGQCACVCVSAVVPVYLSASVSVGMSIQG